MAAKSTGAYDAKNGDLRTTIEKYAKMGKVPLAEMGTVIGAKSYNTWNTRYNDMGKMRLCELRKAVRTLRIPPEEILRSVL